MIFLWPGPGYPAEVKRIILSPRALGGGRKQHRGGEENNRRKFRWRRYRLKDKQFELVGVVFADKMTLLLESLRKLIEGTPLEDDCLQTE